MFSTIFKVESVFQKDSEHSELDFEKYAHPNPIKWTRVCHQWCQVQEAPIKLLMWKGNVVTNFGKVPFPGIMQ